MIGDATQTELNEETPVFFDPDEMPLSQPTLTRQDAVDFTVQKTTLERIQSRVVVKPRRKSAKRKDRLSPSAAKSKKIRKRTPKPSWMMKQATVEDLIGILKLDATKDGSDEVYIDVSEAPEPYNKLSMKVVRQLARKAREFPEICVAWNVLGLCDGSTNHHITLNGRNSPRSGNAAMLRAYAALDTFHILGLNATTNSLKDLGFGSKKSTEYLTSWKALYAEKAE